jgi:hypothetical protein
MRLVDDEEVVEALGSHGAHEPFGKGIRVGGPKGRLDDAGALGREDFVEARHVLGVTVAKHELGGYVHVGQITSHVPRLLGDPRTVRMSRAGDRDSPATELDEEQHRERLE